MQNSFRIGKMGEIRFLEKSKKTCACAHTGKRQHVDATFSTHNNACVVSGPIVYVLKSVPTGRLYIGSSSDPERRLSEHNAGKTTSTKPYIPYVLIYTESYDSKTEALRREKQIKNSGKIRNELKKGIYTAPSSIG